MGSRSRSRSPMRIDQEQQSIIDDINDEPRHIQPAVPTGTKSNLLYKIALSNVDPLTMDGTKMKHFISTTVKSKLVINSIKFANFKKNLSHMIVGFNNKEAAEEACEQLKDVEMNGKKLCPQMLKHKEPRRKIQIKNRIDLRSRSTERGMPNAFEHQYNNETYGLSMQYLQSLGIKPPLRSKLFVTNLSLKVDERKIKEVFSLAGKVIDVYLIKNPDGTSKGSARVVFDHPLEAVQAISMFQYKPLFGWEMKIRFDSKNNDFETMPVGLKDIGPGLGENGTVLQGVRSHLEIQQIKHDLQQWLKSVNLIHPNMNMTNTNTALNWQGGSLQNSNAINFENINPTSVSNQNVQALLQGLLQANGINVLGAQNQLQNVPNIMANMGNQNLANQLNSHSWQGNQPVNNLQMDTSRNVSNYLQNVINHGQNAALMTNMGNQDMVNQPTNQICQAQGSQPGYTRQSEMSQFIQSYPQNVTTHRQNTGDAIDRTEEEYAKIDAGTVVFKNLPRTVSLEDLRKKMQEVGDVKFADISASGKALVRFYKAHHAQKCINLFDGSKVDGQLIEVQYL